MMQEIKERLNDIPSNRFLLGIAGAVIFLIIQIAQPIMGWLTQRAAYNADQTSIEIKNCVAKMRDDFEKRCVENEKRNLEQDKERQKLSARVGMVEMMMVNNFEDRMKMLERLNKISKTGVATE